MGGLTAVVAPPAGAAGQSSLGFGSHVNKVHSSSGKTLRLSVTAFKNTAKGSTDKASVGINLSTRLPFNKGETHAWQFQVTRSDVNYSSGTGTISGSFGKYGSVDLTFNKTGQSTSKCSVSGTMTTVKGRLHGAIHVDTNTKAWGSVNAKSFAFDTPNVLTVNNSCNNGEGTGNLRCFTATTWSAPPIVGGGGSTFVSGYSSTAAGKTKTLVTGTRSTQLSRPSGASRIDTLVATAPAPAISGNNLTVKTSSTGPVSGSAKIAADAPQSGPGYDCTINGQNKTEHTKSYYAGDAWSSANGLRFNFKASSDIVTTKSGAASWSRNTYS